MQNSSIEVSNVITWILSLVALALATLSLYLQRKDKRPNLQLGIERSYYPSMEGVSGGDLFHPVPGFVIRARNVTERKITIEATYFLDGNKERFRLPDNWTVITEIPAQESRTFNVSFSKLDQWLSQVGIEEKGKGRFVLADGSGKEYKTKKIGPHLSQGPITAEELP